ncbi:MAG: AMP phosphorylase [Candidatus Thorarchaeota archaeon]
MTHDAEQTYKAKSIEIFPRGAAAIAPDLSQHIQEIGDCIIQIRSPSNALVVDGVIVDYQIPHGTIGISEDRLQTLGIKDGDPISVSISPRIRPESYEFIRKRMEGSELTKDEISAIIRDVVANNLTPLEKTTLVMSHLYDKWTMDEIEWFTREIAASGEIIDLGEGVFDKHSLGGVPGNKVSILIVPIIAATGLKIPKTSSRAITSPSGTADTMELFAPVKFSADEIREIIKTTKGMIFWGGALNLAPADDILIHQVERPLSINPQSMMLSSIMAKKVSMGVDFLVLDMPTGKGTKVAAYDDGLALAREFAELGRRLGIKVESGITFGDLPVGHNIGPALEAREALRTLENPEHGPTSLVEKTTCIAGILLEMAGRALRGQGQDLAKSILYSGKALSKFREIIEAQGGDPNIQVEDIETGSHTFEWLAPADGWIVNIDNQAITKIAKVAGAPRDPKAGIKFLRKKESCRRGEPILRVYSSSDERLEAASDLLSRLHPITIEGMLLGRL